MELSSSNIKKFLYFFKVLFCISKNGTLHFPAQAQKNPKKQKFNTKKIPYISRNGTF